MKSTSINLSPTFFSLLIKAIVIVIITALAIPVVAQPRYERKSISFVNALWLTTPQVRTIKSKYVGIILSEIKRQIEIPRFDYNPLPDALIADFASAANARSSLTIDEIAGLMQEKLVPPILAIVEGAIKTRAGELVSEEKKQLFLATKAKELGITIEEIEKVMNSAYIYLPILSEFSLKKSKDSGRWTCNMKGGIIWYHIDLSRGSPVVELRVKQETKSMGYGSEEFAVENAAMNLARNLQTATRAIAEFTLTAPISEVQGNEITFPLGKKEGLGMDDPLWVGEWMSVEGGDVKFVKRGWVRVDKVVDNRTNNKERSTAWAVKKGSWSPGMMVKEHPRLGIDIAVKPAAYAFKISDGYIPLFDYFSGGYLHIKEPFEGMTAGLDIDAQINIASIVNSRQSFMLVGGHFLFPPTEFEGSSIFTDLITSPPFVWGIHLGYLKRMYIRQLALSYELKGGAKFYSVVQKFRYLWEEYKLTISNNTIGGEAALNLEWASSPDLNFGVRAGYRLYPKSDVWSFNLKPGDSGELVAEEGYPFPEINHSGLVIGLYLHWTPPELPFDPVGLFRGAIGI